jgi:hypothetical protein
MFESAPGAPPRSIRDACASAALRHVRDAANLAAAGEHGSHDQAWHRVGVVTMRDDGRVDVPDLYRHGFGMKRKGGAGRTA